MPSYAWENGSFLQIYCCVMLFYFCTLQPVIMNQCFFSSIYCELWREGTGPQVTSSQSKETVFAPAIGEFCGFYRSSFYLFRYVVYSGFFFSLEL